MILSRCPRNLHLKLERLGFQIRAGDFPLVLPPKGGFRQRCSDIWTLDHLSDRACSLKRGLISKEISSLWQEKLQGELQRLPFVMGPLVRIGWQIRTSEGKLQFHYVLQVSIHVFRFTREDSNSHTLKEHTMSLGSWG